MTIYAEREILPDLKKLRTRMGRIEWLLEIWCIAVGEALPDEKDAISEFEEGRKNRAFRITKCGIDDAIAAGVPMLPSWVAIASGSKLNVIL